MAIRKISYRYAKSFYNSLDNNKKKIAEIEKNYLHLYSALSKSEDFKRLLNSPIFSLEKKRSVLDFIIQKSAIKLPVEVSQGFLIFSLKNIVLIYF